MSSLLSTISKALTDIGRKAFHGSPWMEGPPWKDTHGDASMETSNQATPFHLGMVKESSINWTMYHKYANRSELDFLDVAKYYDDQRNVDELEMIFKYLHTHSSNSGGEYLNLICRASYYITAHRHQEWLTRMFMSAKNEGIKAIYIDDSGDRTVKNTRKLIWNLLV